MWCLNGMISQPDIAMHCKSCHVNTATPYYTVMNDSKSQDDRSWRVGHVSSAITMSCLINQATCMSEFNGFSVKTGAICNR